MPVEINGLLNHNISSETHARPFSDFDAADISRMARLHDEWGYDKVLVANAATMPDNISIAGFVAAQTTRLGVMLAHRPGFIAPTMAARMLATLDQLMPGRIGVHIITAADDEEVKADGDYVGKVEDELCLLVQVETRAAVEQIAAIAAVDGVDGIFVGPSDLAADLGHLGNPAHPEVQAMLEAAAKACVAAGKPAGILAPVEADARRYIGWGYQFVAVGSDIGLMRAGADALAARFAS